MVNRNHKLTAVRGVVKSAYHEQKDFRIATEIAIFFGKSSVRRVVDEVREPVNKRNLCKKALISLKPFAFVSVFAYKSLQVSD